MICPRCNAGLADEEPCCPNCFLPRRKGKYNTDQVRQLRREPIKEEPPGQSPRSNSAHASDRSALLRRLKPVIVAALIIAALAAGGVLGYPIVFSYFNSEEFEPKAALSALTTFRTLPSNQEGASVDQVMAKELKRARDAGNLLSYRGWHLKAVKGSKTKVLLVFSFQEKGDKEQRAEWVADLTNNTFTPQTDLAAAVYKK